MLLPLPDSGEALLCAGREFRAELQQIKRSNRLARGEWYPYDTLSSLETVTALLDEHASEVLQSVASMPVADIGCGDGDFALLFARFGARVDAIDYGPNNYNKLEGVRDLRRLLALPLQIIDLDLNAVVRLPSECYGLALFLGTLYHLKNPYGVLENLAYQTRWCVLSTRIAQVTPRSRARVEDDAVAYLADGREIGGDATNFWIFSASGLFRIVQRTRWAIAGARRTGCLVDSNPVDGDADERMFLLLKSRVYFPGLSVRLLEGWHAAEQAYRWTEKTFSIEVVLPLEKELAGFTLAVFVPDALISGTEGPSLSCAISGHGVGRQRFVRSGAHLFQGNLPPFSLHEPILRLRFEVENDYSPRSGDVRDLGICVPTTGPDPNAIDFRVF